MDQTKIKNYITLLCNKEKSDLRTSRDRTWEIIVGKDGKKSISYDNSQELINVFSNIKENELKDFFISELLFEIKNKEDVYFISTYNQLKTAFGTSALSFYTLLQLGYVDQAINAYQYRVTKVNCYLLLNLILDLFKEDYNYFTIEQLNELSENFDELNNTMFSQLANQLLAVTTNKGFQILKNEIKGVNIEINRDKESVISKISILCHRALQNVPGKVHFKVYHPD